jgi:hypothetical protein
LSVFIVCCMYYRHHPSRPLLSQVELRRRCEWSVSYMSVCVCIFSSCQSLFLSIFLAIYPWFECCMLEYMYCMLHVLSASPLAALAKSSGTTKTMRVEYVIHVSLRMCILVMSTSISYSICCDEKMLKYSLIYVQSFCLSWSFFAYVVYFLCGPIFSYLVYFLCSQF